MIYLCTIKRNQTHLSQTEASGIVAAEICADWMDENFYPLSEKRVASKIKTEYAMFVSLCKQFNSEKCWKKESWYDKECI